MANQVTTVSFVLGPNASVLDMGAIDGDFSQVLSKVLSPDPNRGQYLARLFNAPNIAAEGVVDNGLTPVATKLFDLTALGVTFPTTTKRLIRWRHWVQTDNDLYYTEYSRWILGGTTPVLLGSRRVIESEGDVAGTIYAYGQLRLHGHGRYDANEPGPVPRELHERRGRAHLWPFARDAICHLCALCRGRGHDRRRAHDADPRARGCRHGDGRDLHVQRHRSPLLAQRHEQHRPRALC